MARAFVLEASQRETAGEVMYLYVILYVIYMRSDQSTGFNNNYIKICLLMVLFAVSGRL